MSSILSRAVALLPWSGNDVDAAVRTLLDALPIATQRALATLEDATDGTAEWAVAVLPVGSRALLEAYGCAEFDDGTDEDDLQPARITEVGWALVTACSERHDVREEMAELRDDELLRAEFTAIVGDERHGSPRV